MIPFIFILGISLFPGVPVIAYLTGKTYFRNSHMYIDSNGLVFNKMVGGKWSNLKYKNMRFYNIGKIKETKWCYKITCEKVYFYYYQKEKEKNPVLKYKKGTFIIPKSFGSATDFRQALYSLLGKTTVGFNQKFNITYQEFTKKGLISLVFCLLGTMIILISTMISEVIGCFSFYISIFIVGNSITVLREENRDRILSALNIILGIVNIILCFLLFSKY